MSGESRCGNGGDSDGEKARDSAPSQRARGVLMAGPSNINNPGNTTVGVAIGLSRTQTQQSTMIIRGQADRSAIRIYVRDISANL